MSPPSTILVHANKGVDAADIAQQRQPPGVIILPEHARVSLMRQDEPVGEHLVADDRISADHVVVLDKRHRLRRLAGEHRPCRPQLAQAEAVGLTQVPEAVGQWKIEGADRVVRLGIGFAQPILDRAAVVRALVDSKRFEGRRKTPSAT